MIESYVFRSGYLKLLSLHFLCIITTLCSSSITSFVPNIILKRQLSCNGNKRTHLIVINDYIYLFIYNVYYIVICWPAARVRVDLFAILNVLENNENQVKSTLFHGNIFINNFKVYFICYN